MKNDFIKNKNSNFKAQNKPKNKPSFYIVVFLLVFVVIGSILGSIAFVRTCDSDNTSNVAYADELNYRFNGGGFIFPTSYNMYSGGGFDYIYPDEGGSYPNIIDDSLFAVNYGIFLTHQDNIAVTYNDYQNTIVSDNGISFYLNNVPCITFQNADIIAPLLSTTLKQTFLVQRVGTGIYDGTIFKETKIFEHYKTYFVYNTAHDVNGNLIRNPSEVNDTTILKGSSVFVPYDTNMDDLLHPLYEYHGFRVDYECNYGFNCNVVKYNKHSVITYDEPNQTNYSTNYLTFYDNNNNYFQISTNVIIKGLINYNSNVFCFNNRTYFVEPIIDGNEVQYLLDQQEIQLRSEFNKEKQALLISYQSQIQSAREAGKAEGYQQAIQQGVGGVSFFNLMASVVDAPIQALSGLLNFSFLGFNLWYFICGILTVAIIVFIVRKFIK